MIRVLHIVTYMGRGGLETMLMNYYRHIDRSKIQFDFLVHRDFRADYDDEIESLGGRIYRLPRLVPWSPAYRRKLNRFFTEHPEYRIVHVHQDCLSAVFLKAAKKHGVPVRIAHSHTSNQDKNLKYFIKLYYRRLIPRFATQMFACSQKAGEWMFRGAPFQILNNAIDAGQYRYNSRLAAQKRKELGISDDSFVMGHVGRFGREKNHEFLLEIFAAIQKKRHNAVLLLVGDGSLRPEIESRITALGLRGKVLLTGVREDVPALLQAMDVFVFPSLYEGLPVTMMEAQASGLPCVVSDRVPSECKKTELVTFLSLRAPAEEWAEQIMSAYRMKREETCAQIAASGFDIVENAKWLQNYYQEQWKAQE